MFENPQHPRNKLFLLITEKCTSNFYICKNFSFVSASQSERKYKNRQNYPGQNRVYNKGRGGEGRNCTYPLIPSVYFICICSWIITIPKKIVRKFTVSLVLVRGKTLEENYFILKSHFFLKENNNFLRTIEKKISTYKSSKK